MFCLGGGGKGGGGARGRHRNDSPPPSLLLCTIETQIGGGGQWGAHGVNGGSGPQVPHSYATATL